MKEGARLGKTRPNGPHKIRDGDPDILPSVEAASLKTNTGASGEKEGHGFGKQMVLREYCVLPPLHDTPQLISSSIPRIHRRRHSRVLVMAATTPNANSAVSSLATTVPVEAILFDIDGTLCDSDPLHHVAFQEMLLEIGYNNGVPIDDEFFIKNIAGRSDVEAAQNLFPDWELEKGLKFLEVKEAKYRSLANERLEPVKGLAKVVQWVKDHGYKRAAVTNAPRINAELMISLLGLSDFFQAVIVGGECEKPKPAPYPYLKALKELQVSAAHTFVFEDSASGIRAGVAAGMPVVGVATRNPEKSLLDAGATLLIKDYEDPKLRSALEEIDIEEAKLKKGGA